MWLKKNHDTELEIERAMDVWRYIEIDRCIYPYIHFLQLHCLMIKKKAFKITNMNAFDKRAIT